MAKAWLLRPMPHNIDRMREFRDNNIIAIGWPEVDSLVGKNKQTIKKLLNQHPLSYSPNELGIAAATVNTFVNDMRIGDVIVVPHGNNIFFCRITSDYFYEPTKASQAEGYPHQRKVEWLKGPVRRDDLFDELRQSLRAPRTLADLSRHLDSILKFINDNPYSPNDSIEPNDNFVVFEYPLRLDVVASIRIPKNITQVEAARLGDFVKTLFFE
ncbi:MAG: hypothetical protein A4E53_01873 [Pelotomaculum sp. PtaB.Bin104]|nr:MAG: hypothetical protein A4E53_01873 [Pelotomaculum sp. PtaB.Bin104]